MAPGSRLRTPTVELFRGGQPALDLARMTKQQQRRSLNPVVWTVWLPLLLLPLLLVLFWQQIPVLQLPALQLFRSRTDPNHGPLPIPLEYQQIIADHADHLVPIWDEASKALENMAVAYNQALLNPASGNGPLSHSSLDLPKFFRALSILLAKTDYVRNDMIFYWSLLTEDDDAGTERLQRKYGAMDSEKIQEANRKLLDMWYDLASNLPADMNTIINTLTNLESMILMTKEPAEIIRTISWAVTSKIGHFSQKVEQLAENMV